MEKGTYQNIRGYVFGEVGFLVETCWIADVKRSNGIPMRAAPNRKSPSSQVKPCPPEKRPAIEAALRHYGMI